MKPRKSVYPTAADGIYVMLRPLPIGKHTIAFGGRSTGNFQSLIYRLTVE